MIDVRAIEASTLDRSLKGYPQRAPPCAVRDIRRQGCNVMRGDLPTARAVLKGAALAHNLEWMAGFMRATGVLLAPHGKTTMVPQLFVQQIESGARGITFATMQQASLGVRPSLRGMILAKQFVGGEDILQAMHLTDATPDPPPGNPRRPPPRGRGARSATYACAQSHIGNRTMSDAAP